MPGIQYTGYSFDITTLVVSFSRSKISYSIRIILEMTINSGIFESTIST